MTAKPTSPHPRPAGLGITSVLKLWCSKEFSSALLSLPLTLMVLISWFLINALQGLDAGKLSEEEIMTAAIATASSRDSSYLRT